MRNLILALLIIAFLAHCEAVNHRLHRHAVEIHNLKGCHVDLMETVYQETHPQRMLQKQIDWLEGKGEFK